MGTNFQWGKGVDVYSGKVDLDFPWISTLQQSNYLEDHPITDGYVVNDDG